MLWVLQTNFYSEPGYVRLVEALERLKLPHMIVKPVPSTLILLPAETDTSKATQDVEDMEQVEVDPSQKIITFGSYTLAKIAAHRGWSPGAWLENMDYATWSRHGSAWGPQRVLNPNAHVVRFADASFTDEAAFVRPVEDTKAFSGKVFERTDFKGWQAKVLERSTGADTLNADTMVLISEPKVIHTESRLFVVNGEIVTWSQYKRGKQVYYSAAMVDEEVLDFGRQCVNVWTPNKAFVLDIAQTPDGCKIVEVNCLNAAGFYDCDTMKLVTALEDFVENK